MRPRRPRPILPLALGALLLCSASVPAAATVRARQEPATSAADRAELSRLRERVAQLERELADERAARAAERAELERELAALRREAAADTELRMQREREWLSYTSAIARLELPPLPEDIRFEPDLPAEELERARLSGEPEGDAAPADGAARPGEPAGLGPEELAARRARGAELLRSLRASLRVDNVRGLDPLELGLPQDGATGPVVFRLLDGAGRLAGGLYAERLRLEGSRSGKTVTLVFEDGYEMRGGERLEFGREGVTREGQLEPAVVGTRRVQLPYVDPLPWIESMPELFGPEGLGETLDDGIWDGYAVRRSLNELLAQDAAGGRFRMRALGGVVAHVLREVHVEELAPGGGVERRLFADRLVIQEGERGVVLLFEDGVQVRGGLKTPFLDGRLRVVLPRADVEAWRARPIPGLSVPSQD